MTKDEIYEVVNRILLESNRPSEELLNLIKEREFDSYPFEKIVKLSQIDQNPKYHPEGSVLNHILLVVDEASKNKEKSKDKKVFMWSALLHDIGKLTTTRIRKNRITSYNHDIEGEKISKDFLDKLTDDDNFKHSVSKMVRYHMQPLFFDKNLPFFEPEKMIKEVDCNEVALLSLCDRLGRGNLTEETIENENERIVKFKEFCSKVIK